MISRTLGPEFGGAIGLTFTFAISISCAMHIIGFAESVIDLLKHYFDGTVITGDFQHDKRIIGAITLLVLAFIAVIGMTWVIRAQYLFLAMILVAQMAFVIGVFIGPTSEEKIAKGFVGRTIVYPSYLYPIHSLW